MKLFSQLSILLALAMASCPSADCKENLVAFTNVHLISMQNEGMAASQTVIIKGDRIVGIGASEESFPPDGTKIIDGTGFYLVPGLVDAHVHLDNKIGARPDFGDAPLFLAYGITTVFNLRGEPVHLEWKKRIREGSLLAPNLYTSGEFVNEPRINTPEEAEREVALQIREGYDLIKFREVIDFEKHRVLTTEGLERSAYLRLNKAAKEGGMPLVGHAPYRVGLAGLLQSGQSLAHINELANLYFLPPLDLNRGAFIQMAKGSFALLAVILVLWFVTGWLRRKPARLSRIESPQVMRIRNTTTWVVLFSAICFILWILVVPPGLAFGNFWLLISLSVLGLIVLIMVAMLFVLTFGIWKEQETVMPLKILTLLISLAATGLSIGLVQEIPFAWRGSDMMISRVAQDCKEAGLWIQSTLVAQEIYYDSKDGFRRSQIVEDPAFLCLSDDMQKSWRRFVDDKLPLITRLWNRHPEFNRRLIFALRRAEVPLMAGTDAMGAPLIVPGLSLHQEMELLQESGLSPYEVLWTATVGPAKFLGKVDEFGTIAVGKRADLLLIQGNPLEDISCLKVIKGVMVRGRWLPESELNRMIQTISIDD
jgi:hypothetical protein